MPFDDAAAALRSRRLLSSHFDGFPSCLSDSDWGVAVPDTSHSADVPAFSDSSKRSAVYCARETVEDRSHVASASLTLETPAVMDRRILTRVAAADGSHRTNVRLRERERFISTSRPASDAE